MKKKLNQKCQKSMCFENNIRLYKKVRMAQQVKQAKEVLGFVRLLNSISLNPGEKKMLFQNFQKKLSLK